MLARHSIEIPRQTLARWVIQCSEYFQPLLNLMRNRLLESSVIHSGYIAVRDDRRLCRLQPVGVTTRRGASGLHGPCAAQVHRGTEGPTELKFTTMPRKAFQPG